jgi:hypothetical protein
VVADKSDGFLGVIGLSDDPISGSLCIVPYGQCTMAGEIRLPGPVCDAESVVQHANLTYGELTSGAIVTAA